MSFEISQGKNKWGDCNMKVVTKVEKTILGEHYPKNTSIEVPEAQARFLIDKEGFEEYREEEIKLKGGKK
uniref:DUF7210 domain-containing protein n=1 Tax=viral metagenome TaxID=1070528 RepID=A0A6H2A1N9_9ZZZZ